MSSSLISAAFAVLLTMGCLAGIGVLWFFVLRRPKLRRPSCGQCGYAVEGLESMSCPECGSDLREVGIVTPQVRMMHPWLFVLLWTILLALPVAMLSGPLMRLGPQILVSDSSLRVATNSGSIPELAFSLRREQTVRGPSFGVTGTSVNVVDEGEGETVTINFPSTKGVTPRTVSLGIVASGARIPGRPARFKVNRSGATEAPFDRAKFERWIDSIVDDTAATERPADVEEFVKLIDAYLQDKPTYTTTRLQTIGGIAVTGRTRAAPWYVALLIAAAIAIYVGGIILFLFVRSKHRASRAG